jgi:hypothetical protein
MATKPSYGTVDDLPVGCGILHYSLLPKTKSSRTKRADLTIACKPLSGYRIRKWFHPACISSSLGYNWATNTIPIFCHPVSTHWTSLYFPWTYIYPSLTSQQQAGDPYIDPYTY